MLRAMTDLDPETKARIEAEERYRAELRAKQGSAFPVWTALGVLGGVLLIFGSFLPIASLPVLGNTSLFSRGTGDGLILSILGLFAIAFSFIPRARLVVTIAGLLSLLAVLLDFKAVVEMQNKEYGNLVQLQFGWAVLGFGIILTLIAPILYRQR